jgi:hypothetical protein
MWTVRGSNPSGGGDFPHPSRSALGPTQPPIQWVPSFSLGVNRPGRGIDHPLQSSAEVKERVELYPYSPSGPLWPVTGWTLVLPVLHVYAQCSVDCYVGFFHYLHFTLLYAKVFYVFYLICIVYFLLWYDNTFIVVWIVTYRRGLLLKISFILSYHLMMAVGEGRNESCMWWIWMSEHLLCCVVLIG